MRSFSLTVRLALIGVLISAGAGDASSMPLPMWPLDYVILKSQLIVQGQVVDDHFLAVDRVFLGQASHSNRIEFASRLELTVIVDTDCDRATMKGYRGLPCRTMKGKPAVLFLTKTNPTDKWETTGWGSGMKWLDDGEVWGYYQPINPGGYALLPEKRTPEDLYHAINDGLEKRSRYVAALNSTNPEKRIDGLLPFVQDPKHYQYWREAVFDLASTGPMAGESLRQLADKLKGNNLRVIVIEAIGKSGDTDSTTYLSDIVSSAEPLVKKGESRGTPDERTRMDEWKTALCSLAVIGDKRALPMFRESIFDAHQVEEFYGIHTAGCIWPGINKNPTPESISVFQRLFTLYPGLYGWENSTKWVSWRGLEFLEHHKFREAIPLLVEQLDHPDAYTKQQAHQFLTEIAGQDLGWSKKAWLAWDTRYRPTK